MIAVLRGHCIWADDESIVLDVNGVGYLVRATTGVIAAASQAGDAELTVFIHTNVREDAIQLFGFASRMEQLVFERLTTLQGVGPKVALAVVSAFDPPTIRRAADTEDVALLQSVPGVGPKVARRIATELKDKLVGLDGMTLAARVTDGGSVEDADRSFYDARAALVELGLSVQVAESALLNTDPASTVDDRIRQALKAVR